MYILKIFLQWKVIRYDLNLLEHNVFDSTLRGKASDFFFLNIQLFVSLKMAHYRTGLIQNEWTFPLFSNPNCHQHRAL